jgi:hypothetical protein
MKKILMNLFLLVIFVCGLSISSCSKNKESNNSNINSSITDSYSITINPAPTEIRYGAYGTLTVTIVNNTTGEIVENPDVVWIVSNSFGTFDSPNSSSTIFRAKQSGTESFGQTITVIYKTFTKTFSFIGGKSSFSHGTIWTYGNNDNNLPSGSYIKISYAPKIDAGVTTIYTVDVYHNDVLDTSADCSDALWTFSVSGRGFSNVSGFSNISGVTGKTVSAKLDNTPWHSSVSVEVTLRGRQDGFILIF